MRVLDVIEVVEEPVSIVNIVTAGPQGATGPMGPQGPQGVSGDFGVYTFLQVAPATHWLVSHNLGVRPSVTVVDTAGTVVEGDVTYISDDQLTIDFNYLFAGAAYLS